MDTLFVKVSDMGTSLESYDNNVKQESSQERMKLSANISAPIVVSAVNDAPIFSLSSTDYKFKTEEDIAISLPTATISDSDGPSPTTPYDVTVFASYGNINLPSDAATAFTLRITHEERVIVDTSRAPSHRGELPTKTVASVRLTGLMADLNKFLAASNSARVEEDSTMKTRSGILPNS